MFPAAAGRTDVIEIISIKEQNAQLKPPPPPSV